MSDKRKVTAIDEKNLMVWTCKIVVEGNELPPGFDSPPRMAAEAAITEAGFVVLMNSSGWGGSLSEVDREYLADTMDISEHDRLINGLFTDSQGCY